MMNTNEFGTGEKLGGEMPRPTMVTPVPKPTTPKKRSKKHRGYIRGKKVNGKTYYYYCWTERNAAGGYPEKSEYLGTAERIYQAVKGKNVAEIKDAYRARFSHIIKVAEKGNVLDSPEEKNDR